MFQLLSIILSAKKEDASEKSSFPENTLEAKFSCYQRAEKELCPDESVQAWIGGKASWQ